MSSSHVQFKDTLLHGNITKNIVVLALPIITAHFFANAYYIIDMIFVGRLGLDALAAVSIGGTLMSLVWTFLVGLSIGTSSLTARYYGSQNAEMVERIAYHSLFLSFVVSLFLAIFGIIWTPALLKLLGGSEEVVRLGTTYTRIVFCGAGGLIFMFIINSLFRGSGDVKIPMYTLGISSFLNIALDPLLIFGIGPFPELGIKGAAIATVIGQGSGALFNLFILFKGFSRIKIAHIFFPIDTNTLKSIVTISIPGSLQNLTYSISGVILMRLVAAFGTVAVAAYGIGIRLDIMVMLPGWAIGAAVSTILGQNLGAKQPDRAEKTGWHGAGLYLLLLFVVCGLLWLFAPQVIALFNAESTVVSIGESYIRIVAVGYVFLSTALILNMAMNGAGYTFVPMLLIAIAHLGVRVPAAYLFTATLNMDTKGIWLAISGSLILQAVLAAIWFRLGHWKHKKVLHK